MKIFLRIVSYILVAAIASTATFFCWAVTRLRQRLPSWISWRI